jgi:hypothetical protein
MTTVPRFPELAQQAYDTNPAIQIFGRRFFKDQTEIEYLVEFFLVFLSPKYVDKPDAGWGVGLPEKEILDNWPANTTLKYFPEPKLGLKLFSFLGSSKLETRHNCHKDHFKQILANLKDRIETDFNISKNEVLEILEQLLCGFVGVAANRTWCTQVYLPVSQRLIAGETIWQRVKGNKTENINITWDKAVDDGLFEFSKQTFLARGGEVLYLQLCNLIRFFGSTELLEFEKRNGFNHGEGEKSIINLTIGLESFFNETTPIDDLCQWIEHADKETEHLTKDKKVRCGWCPEESWPEAYLFAHEFANICRSSIDPMEKIEMLTMCCVFQVLRSLCAQACRYNGLITDELHEMGGANGFSWIVTSEKLDDTALRETAKNNLVRIQEIICGALRHPDVLPPAPNSKTNYEKKGDEQGHELFVHLAKRIGFIVPRTGPGARMVISDNILRYLVLSLIPPGESRTLQSFENRLYCHYGIAINGKTLEKAVRWTHPRQMLQISNNQKNWLEENLLAAGFLIPLSDAVSQVRNPFS